MGADRGANGDDVTRKSPRSIALTKKGLEAIGKGEVVEIVEIPLLDIPWYEDREKSGTAQSP